MLRHFDLKFAIIKAFGSQSEFSLKAGCDATFVSMVLHGHRKLDLERSARWLRLLKCDESILHSVTKEQI